MKIQRSPIALSLLVLVAAALLSSGAVLADPEGIRYEDLPAPILTPDEVETRLGTLEFFDGFPSADTVEKAYDHLDFLRGVRAFLDGIPIASLYAMREGLQEVGC